MTEEISAEELWEETRHALQQGDINRPLWEAAAAVRPITVDQDTLILGLPPAERQHASYLETAVNKSRIQQIFESLVGRRLDLRVISGTTEQDWERLRQREQGSMDATAARARAQVTGRGALNAWREGGQEVSALLKGTRARAGSMHLAQSLIKALPLIWQTEQEARQQEAAAEDMHSQQLDSILERVATYCNLPAPVVALEYLRYRSAKDKM